MRKFRALIAILFSAGLFLSTAAYADQWVKSYYRSDGTHVRGHYRSDPDGDPYNNYSFPGNVNPHTGNTALGNPSSYLRKYNGNRETREDSPKQLDNFRPPRPPGNR